MSSGIERWVVIALALAGVLPGAASGAWSETAQRRMTGNEVATCLRAPAPAVITALGAIGQRSISMDHFAVGSAAGGFTFQQRAPLGFLLDCAAVASNGSGTVVFATQVLGHDQAVIQASISSAGRLRTVSVATLPLHALGGLAAAVSARGDVVVAWEESSRAFSRRSRSRVLAARLSPGALLFGAPGVVSGWRPKSRFGNVKIAAGMDASGRATLVWARSVPDRIPFPLFSAVEATTADPGQPFAPVQVLTPSAHDSGEPALDVNPDGRALLAFSANDAISVAERPAGAGKFGAPFQFKARGNASYEEPSIDLFADGAAVVAWRSNNSDERGGVHASVRAGPGAFGPVITIQAAPGGTFGSGGLTVAGSDDGRPIAPLDEAGRRLRVLLTGDRRVVLTWVEPRYKADGDLLLQPRVALGSLAGGRFAVRTLGSPCRPANGVTPAVTADGLVAVAWTDNHTESTLGAGLTEFPEEGGRLHLAGLTTAATRGSAPAITVRANAQRLHYTQPLRIAVRCNGPCDLRGVVRGRVSFERLGGERVRLVPDGPHAIGMASRARAGWALLNVAPGLSQHVARHRRPGRVRVAVHACTPASGRMSRRVVQVRVGRKRIPALQAPVAVRAHRAGSRIVVRWRTRRPALRMGFYAEGRARKRVRKVDPTVYGFGFVEGRGRRSFSTTIEPERPRAVRWVALEATQDDPPRRTRLVLVRVGRP